MNAKRTWMIAWMWIAAASACPALAQYDDEADEAPDAEIETQQMSEPDEGESDAEEAATKKRASRFKRPVRTTNLDRLETLMKRELELDEYQIEEIERLFEIRREEYEEELHEQKTDLAEGEARERMQEMLMRMREARDDEDQETMREISQTIRNWHTNRRVVQVTDEFAALVEEQLEEEQIERFRRFLAKGRPGAERERAIKTNPGMLRRYVLRLRPDDDQREAMEELYNEFRTELRNGIPTKDEREEMAADFYEQVMELLDDDQKVMLKKYVGGDERRSRGNRARRKDRPSYDEDDAPDEEAQESEEGEAEEDVPDEDVADEDALDEEAGDEENGEEEEDG